MIKKSKSKLFGFIVFESMYWFNLNWIQFIKWTELGPFLLKCNHYNYNYFDISAITITAFFHCNALHYNYFTNVIDNYISITSITLSSVFGNLIKITIYIIFERILWIFHKISICVGFYYFCTYRLWSVRSTIFLVKFPC